MAGIISSVFVFIILFFVILYDMITFPFYLIIYKSSYKVTKPKDIKVIEVEVGDLKRKTYICSGSTRKKEDFYSKFETVNDIMKYSIPEHRYKNCMGSREILDVKESFLPDGTKIHKYIIGPYKWMTYNVLKDTVMSVGRGLHSLGLEPKMSVALYLDTRAEWMESALACFFRNIIVIILDTSIDSVSTGQIMMETRPSALITSEELIPGVLKFIDALTSVNTIVYVGQDEKESILKLIPNTISIYSFTEVFERGKNVIIEGCPPNPDDIAVITHTRGTTAPPKALAVSHRDLVAAIKSYQSRLYFTSSDVMICYWPTSNLIEFILGLTITMVGGSIGFSSNLVNKERNLKVIFGVHSDSTVLRPTVMFAYPQLLLQFNKSIAFRVNKLGVLSRSLVTTGIRYKKFWMPKGFRTPLTDRIIFSKTAMMIGGNMRMIVCGGSFLPAATQMYSSITLCTSVIQSYLHAENANIGFCQSLNDGKVGILGKPMEGAYIRLEDISENWCEMRKPVSELVIGGTSISQRSTSFPHENDDYFMDGGIRWFRTGDAVMMHQDGSFSFVDRKANIIKLSDGNCVALGQLQAIYKMSPLVRYLYFYGDRKHVSLVAILVICEEYIAGLVPATDFTYSPHQQLQSELKIKSAVSDHFLKLAKSFHLYDYEIPAAIMLEENEWTPESGLLTTTYQVKRELMYAKYETQIANMYEVLTNIQKYDRAKRILVFFGDQLFPQVIPNDEVTMSKNQLIK